VTYVKEWRTFTPSALRRRHQPRKARTPTEYEL